MNAFQQYSVPEELLSLNEMRFESLKATLRREIEQIAQRAKAGEVKTPHIRIPEVLLDMLPNLFMNTLETTALLEDDGSLFVITGDIEAMWLRDSSAQVTHYMPWMRRYPEVASMILALIVRQFQCICYDPYANSFNRSENDRHWELDEPAQKPGVWEQKYELDSLIYPLRLLRSYTSMTGDERFYQSPLFIEAIKRIVATLEQESQRDQSPYYFIRKNVPSQDTLSHGGKGAPVSNDGLIFSGFRPSDDACVLGYHIPDCLFAELELGKLAEQLEKLLRQAEVSASASDAALPSGSGVAGQAASKLSKELLEAYRDLGARLSKLAHNLEVGRKRHATVLSPTGESIYAYEVDGLGGQVLMDDANVPSLLSLPYLGICKKDDPLYLRTRRFCLSTQNPYYYEGKAASGIGSPHTPEDYIWCISLTIQAITSTDPDEINRLLEMLARAEAGTGYMHEGFHKDRPEEFTREWFAWANSILAYLLQILILGEEEMACF